MPPPSTSRSSFRWAAAAAAAAVATGACAIPEVSHAKPTIAAQLPVVVAVAPAVVDRRIAPGVEVENVDVDAEVGVALAQDLRLRVLPLAGVDGEDERVCESAALHGAALAVRPGVDIVGRRDHRCTERIGPSWFDRLLHGGDDDGDSRGQCVDWAPTRRVDVEVSIELRVIDPDTCTEVAKLFAGGEAAARWGDREWTRRASLEAHAAAREAVAARLVEHLSGLTEIVTADGVRGTLAIGTAAGLRRNRGLTVVRDGGVSHELRVIDVDRDSARVEVVEGALDLRAGDVAQQAPRGTRWVLGPVAWVTGARVDGDRALASGGALRLGLVRPRRGFDADVSMPVLRLADDLWLLGLTLGAGYRHEVVFRRLTLLARAEVGGFDGLGRVNAMADEGNHAGAVAFGLVGGELRLGDWWVRIEGGIGESRDARSKGGPYHRVGLVGPTLRVSAGWWAPFRARRPRPQ